MGDQVEVPFGENPSETATLLLAAAEELGLDQGVVGTVEGGFLVPSEVNDKAFPPKAAKKTAAKKKG
jgi:hypothetical protein